MIDKITAASEWNENFGMSHKLFIRQENCRWDFNLVLLIIQYLFHIGPEKPHSESGQLAINLVVFILQN